MRRRRREVQIFSFSFLDILATTLGVLLFILLFAILNRSGIGASAEWQKRLEGQRGEQVAVQRRAELAKRAHDQAVSETQEVRKAGAGLSGNRAAEVAETNEALDRAIQETKNEIKGLEDRIASVRRQVDELEGGLRGSDKGVAKLPKAKGGGRGRPIHVDCQRDGVFILGADVEAEKESRRFCATDGINDAGNAFDQLIGDIQGGRLPRDSVIVLWVRPDGVKAAKAAIQMARQAKVRLGWEPADQDWEF